MSQVGEMLKGEKADVVARQKVSAFIEVKVAVAVDLGRRRSRGVLKWGAEESCSGDVPRDVADAWSASQKRTSFACETCWELTIVRMPRRVKLDGRITLLEGRFSCKRRVTILIDMLVAVL